MSSRIIARRSESAGATHACEIFAHGSESCQRRVEHKGLRRTSAALQRRFKNHLTGNYAANAAQLIGDLVDLAGGSA